ncbi:phosphatidylinositol-specific phospholipase C/glycerophosphodiester phosphodiesterase family protein [Arsenicibacter rosenii]|uniref:Glycerophosphodiester phosphodiesterase n=1 Tax=Arsenicibacter rosenii TaxID=1750698 RepID=A0A1S2VI02_9BACT|nr:phosphatidylinositol-specific phospholipase C/glycerophosphodiester phosphodiesterase family protein [Arsenicibacter rosenii]OIN58381.1 glycerophosphodiester phosphodiesterase [Arsenicibacter rosenii]
MKRTILFLSFCCCYLTSFAQKGPVRVHAHNDYEKPKPFQQAYESRADFIEADVWLHNGKLVVAHTREEINPALTLDSLYINPIIKRYSEHKDRISSDRSYAPALVIDVKDKFEEVFPLLSTQIQKCINCFNRTANPMAVQLIISGNRPKPDVFLDYPPYIWFDGRPTELYDEETLKRVALVSDNFKSYSRWDGTGEIPEADREKLKRIIKRAHNDDKPIRFWAIPDSPNGWKQLRKLGVDIINTDKVAECIGEMK